MSSKPLRRQLFGIRNSLVQSVSITNVFGQEVSTLYEDIMDPSSFTTLQFLETPVPGTEEQDRKICQQTRIMYKLFNKNSRKNKADRSVTENLYK